MVKNSLKLFLSLFKKPAETQESIKNNIRMKVVICIILAFGSLLLTIFNIIQNNRLMMWTTTTLAIVFAVCAVLAGVFKIRTFTDILMSVTVVAIFSYYAIAGQNDGFAILWILVAPMVTMLFLPFSMGFGISVYFLLFIIIIFYTPLKDMIPGRPNYTDTFILRFPALYLVTFVTSLILCAQKIFYAARSEENSLFDLLTSLKNRRYYSDFVSKISNTTLNDTFTVISVDINNLKTLNDKYGHDTGDTAIVESGKILTRYFSNHTNEIFRTGGDEFFIFLEDNQNEIYSLIALVKGAADEVILGDERLSLSIGYAKYGEVADKDINAFINLAEKNMYKDKEEFYRTYHGERRRAYSTNDNK